MVVTPQEAARTLLERAEARARDLEARREAVLRRIPELAAALRESFGATEVWLFGSLAWGGFREGSDVDLAVRGVRPARIDEAMVEAWRRLDQEVDVVDMDTLSSEFRARIEREGTRLA